MMKIPDRRSRGASGGRRVWRAHAASRVEHGVHGEHQSDDAGDGGGKLGGAQVGILREGPEHIVQDVLLLADEARPQVMLI